MKARKVSRIECWVSKEISHLATEALEELGLPEVFTASARSVVLREKSFKLAGRGDYKIEEDPVEYFSFCVPPKHASRVLGFMAEKTDLSFPGRGSIYRTDISVYRKEEPFFDDSVFSLLPKSSILPLKDLEGLVAIVRRGRGNEIAKALLDSGRALPMVTFGEGVGLRDKLGLLRITVPAEKEIVHAVVPQHDADEIFDYLTRTAKLDHPGKGFLYSYSIAEGLIDTRMIRGKSSYIASMEQIVSAIDTMKGHADWRRGTAAIGRGLMQLGGGRDSREILRVLYPEGEGNDKIRLALDLGAGGATRSRSRILKIWDDLDRTAQREYEINDLIVDRDIREKILDQILWDEEIIEVGPVNRVETYRGEGRTPPLTEQEAPTEG